VARVLVLGAGMVGRAIARDLAKAHEVTSADVSTEALAQLAGVDRLTTLAIDLSDAALLKRTVAGFDLVVGAVPGFMGHRTLRTVLEAARPIVDISFAPEEALDLDVLAKASGVPAIVDMGVAPGMDNLILGYHARTMEVEHFECLVGGLPVCRTWPFEYRAPFSPIDVIEEYTRPARYVENRHVVVRPALSDAELVEFEGVGTLEAFNTDGLRSLLHTMRHVPNMKEKTLRYPGHVRLIQALKASGFFSTGKIKIGSADVSPLEFTGRLLTQAWRSAPDERELTVMRVTITGREDNVDKTYTYHLHDEYDPATATSSMARTTGYACTAAAEWVLQGRLQEPGVFPPELIGRDPECFAFIMKYQAQRGIYYRAEEKVGF
jgi:lysine 6-dehydrogenase